MSSKSCQRQSKPQVGRNQFISRATEKGLRRPRLILGLVMGLLVVAAVWLGVKFWNASDHGGGIGKTSGPADPQGRSAVGRSARGERRAENNAAFSTKVNRGNELLSEDKPEEALQVLNEAAKMNPADEDVHYDLGLALTRLGKIDEAIQEYEEALRLYPDYVEAHNNLGNLLMRKQRSEEAIRQFETAVKIMPDYASAHNNLGTALQKIGRTNEALTHFARAVKINPEYWQAHFNLANSYFAAGRLSETRSELETVLRLQPDFGPAKAALAELDARKSK